MVRKLVVDGKLGEHRRKRRVTFLLEGQADEDLSTRGGPGYNERKKKNERSTQIG